MTQAKQIRFWEILSTLLSALGGVLSFLLLVDHRTVSAGEGISLAFCDGRVTNGCRLAALSPYSEILPGLPVSAVALSFFAVSFFTAAWFSIRGSQTLNLYRTTWFKIQTIALLVSVVYSALLLVKIGVVCRGCLWVHATNAALLLTRFAAYRSTKSSLEPISDSGRSFPASIFLLIHFAVLFSAMLCTFTVYRAFVPNLPPQFLSQPEKTVPPVKDVYKITLGREGEVISLTIALDPACPYCKEHLFNLSEALVASHLRAEVSLILFPLDSHCNPALEHSSPGSCSATRIAICQAQSGRFGEFIRSAYNDQGKLVDDLKVAVSLVEHEKTAENALYACANSRSTSNELDRQLRLLESTKDFEGVDSVPTSWFRGKRITGRLRSSEWVKALRELTTQP
ncbi:MAG: hypothetical protein H7301_03190 [Cryobacterium sp.]|nr:hypothetical protein [Oligoflexia bacterium]